MDITPTSFQTKAITYCCMVASLKPLIEVCATTLSEKFLHFNGPIAPNKKKKKKNVVLQSQSCHISHVHKQALGDQFYDLRTRS